MSLRKSFEKNQYIIGPILLGIVAVTLFVIWSKSGSGHSDIYETAWIYNMDSGQLSTMPAPDAITPITLDDGIGYRAFVYTCGSCSEDERKVAYLIKFTSDAQDNTPREGDDATGNSEFVASIEMAKNNEWIEGNLHSRSDLMFQASQTCPETYRVCQPR